MPIEPPCVAVKTNGYILRNDGMAGMSTPLSVEMHQVTNYKYDGTVTNLFDEETLDTEAALAQVNPSLRLPVAPTAGALLPNPPGPYNTFTQEIVFFPTTALP